MSHIKIKKVSIQTTDKNRLALKLCFSIILKHTIMGLVVRYLATQEVLLLACCDVHAHACASDISCVPNAVSIIMHNKENPKCVVNLLFLVYWG
jgi:hypothetical protein